MVSLKTKFLRVRGMLEAIVLCGGFGTRLRQVLPNLPKPMAPVAGRPFLEIILSSLKSKGFSRVILAVGYMADKIFDYFGDQYNGIELLYCNEKEPLNTGGAIRLALTACLNNHVYIFNGDSYLDLEIDDVEGMWDKNRQAIIVARYVDNVERYGSIEFKNGKLLGFIEKGPAGPGLINAGCYVLKSDQFNHIPLYEPFSIERDYFAYKSNLTNVDIFITDGLFLDIGTPEDYASAENILAHI